MLNSEQNKAFDNFQAARAIFDPLPKKMLSSRSQEDWNLANHWLSTKAAPLGFQIKVILTIRHQHPMDTTVSSHRLQELNL